MRPAGQRRQVSWAGVATLGALAGAIAFAMLSHWGTNARPARPFLDEADRLAESVGFGISQISVTGQRMTPDSDIFAALALENARSLIRFDSVAARARIERLPWVKTATITRVLPDAISISVTERRPFAVWSRPGNDSLIDGTGRVLGPIPAGFRGDLPRVAGEGAPLVAAAMLAEIGRYPTIAGRLTTAVFVGERRWTLQLNDGPDVELPAGQERSALEALVSLDDQSHILDGRFSVVDMRAPGRLILRPRTPGDAPAPMTPTAQPSG